MFYKNIDGKETPYMLASIGTGVQINNLKDAIEIHPHEEYWMDKVPSYPIRYFGDGANMNAKRKLSDELASKYWVLKKDYEHYSEVIKEIGINQKHVDNLIFILDNYEPDPVNQFGMDIDVWQNKKVLAQANEFQKLLESLKKSETDVVKVDVTVDEHIVENGEYNVVKKRFNITEPDVARFFKLHVKSDLDGEPSLIQTILSEVSDLKKGKAVLHPADVKKKYAFQRFLILTYDYLADKKISKSHGDASRSVGLLFTAVKGAVPTKEYFETEAIKDGSFVEYEKYLTNDVRMKIERALERRGRTKRFQN